MAGDAGADLVQRNSIRVMAVPTAEVRAFAERRGYGRVPPYLQEVMGILEQEQEYIEALPTTMTKAEIEDRTKKPVRLLTDMERTNLLQGLGAKREQIIRCFESDLALHKDHAWKQRVKERYIPEIIQIDKDIAQLDQKYIFVDSSNSS